MTYDEIVALIRKVDTDIKFDRIAREEAKRTVLCRPEDVDRVRWQVDQTGLDDVLAVLDSPHVAVGQMYVMDVQASEAGLLESLDEALRRSRARSAEQLRYSAALWDYVECERWLARTFPPKPGSLFRITGV